jgi:DNA-binding NarL/FixJ family response regulator
MLLIVTLNFFRFSRTRMASQRPILFLVEDCPNLALLIERAVLCEMPDVRILWARDIEEATRRSAGLEIELFLVDIYLPDGNGLDFLWKVAMEHPTARAIVMTGFPRPEHESLMVALGAIQFLRKPIELHTLVEQLRAALNKAGEGDESHDFRAALRNVTPAEIVQLKCLARATTIVEFLSEENVGRIRFEDGEITDATAGTVRGENALYEIIGWKRGQVTERPCVGFTERTIERSWQNLLMDAAQRADERQPVAGSAEEEAPGTSGYRILGEPSPLPG